MDDRVLVSTLNDDEVSCTAFKVALCRREALERAEKET